MAKKAEAKVETPPGVKEARELVAKRGLKYASLVALQHVIPAAGKDDFVHAVRDLLAANAARVARKYPREEDAKVEEPKEAGEFAVA